MNDNEKPRRKTAIDEPVSGCIIRRPWMSQGIFAGWGPKLFIALVAACVTALSGAGTAMARGDVTACEHPNASASVVRATVPIVPDLIDRAPLVSLPAATIVRIDLDETGRLRNSALDTSSGDPALDRAALVATRSSTFVPAIDGCRSAAGSFIYVVNFVAP
jgi:TonB family protein